MTDRGARQQDLQRAMMEMIAQFTQIPFGLYECRDGRLEEIIPEGARDNFEEYCKLIQTFDGGRALCDEDQDRRAREAFRSDDPALSVLCHAGIRNRRVPIRVGKEVKAVFIHGEVPAAEDAERSIELHNEAVRKLNLNEEQAARLRALLLQVGKYEPAQLKTIENLIATVEKMLCSWAEEEEKIRHTIESVTHELVTRLQGVMARAENLQKEANLLSPREVGDQASEIVESTNQLNTVVQNLGDYLEAYYWATQPIEPILRDSKRTYEAEAAKHGIEIRLELVGVAGASRQIELSRRHMQYTINNLLHNAIKYSFRGAHNRQRYVRIHGQPHGDRYQITISNYGVGILPEEINSGKIFEDGYQGKLTNSEYRTGSGKGLHFVKKVIDRHHGQIEVSSKLVAEDGVVSEGKPHRNRFTIYLPYQQPEGTKRP